MSNTRILVLRGGAIGDFICTLPALHALRVRWPESHIELIGYPHIAQLAQAGGLVDTVESLDKAEMAKFFTPQPAIASRQKDYIRSFDLVISYLYDPDDYVRNSFISAGARQFIYGCPIVRQTHAVDTLMKPLEELAIYPEGVETPRLEIKPPYGTKGRDILKQFNKPVIALHPGSGSPAKNWPLNNFLLLCSLLSEQTSFMPVILLGEADSAIQSELAASKISIPVISGQSLVEIAGIISQCNGYVGNDSGITHLAAALQIPVLAIFASDKHSTWAPRGSNTRIVSATSLEDIQPLQVFTGLKALIARN